MIARKYIRREYECIRCGHRWKAKRPHPPKKCPRCMSIYWCVPRRAKGDYSRCGLHNKIKSMAKKLKPIPDSLLR